MPTEENGFPGMLLTHQNISRRVVLRNLTALALAGGGIAQLIIACGPVSPGATTRPSPGAASSSLYTYRGHSKSVNALAWSSDSKRIASGGDDQTVQVWDAMTGAHAFTYKGHTQGVFALDWAPDGKRIVSGSADKTVQVWDAADGGQVFTYRGHTSKGMWRRLCA